MRTDRIRRVFVALAVGVGLAAAVKVVLLPSNPVNRLAQLRSERLPTPFEALKPLHAFKTRPAPDDWLASYAEHGETLAEYLQARSSGAAAGGKTAYLIGVGALSPDQQQLVALAHEYLGHFYGLGVKTLEPVSSSDVPENMRRYNRHTAEDAEQRPNQLLTTWVLEDVLIPRRPDDAIAVIAITGEDLYPEESWNYVFGQANPSQRVGVWSLYRFGPPQLDPSTFDLALHRTLKMSAHELGHLLSIPHCPAYECVMNGTNHLDETDSRPLEPCPGCLAKVQAATGVDVAARFEALRRFWQTRTPPEGLREYLEAAASVVKEKR